MLPNFIVICLDLNVGQSNDDDKNWITEIQGIVDSVNAFTDPDDCVDFLTEMENENILMIVSGDSSRNMVSSVEEFDQLKSIYVLCRDKALQEIWTNEFKKVKGVSTNVQDFFHSLTRDIRQCNEARIPFNIIMADDDASTPSNELDQSFMYTQLLKEIILKIKYDNHSKQQFIDFCRSQYPDNDRILQKIDRFDHDYATQSPVWWYSKETFIYSMLNRALRKQEIDVIIKMGFFIQDIHRQIEHFHKESSDKFGLLTLYRGQLMSNNDFEKLRKGKGCLLSFNNFLSTSADRAVSLCFADMQDEHKEVGVLFAIKINSKLSSTPFISLDTIGNHPDEQEILFSMHSIFKIGEVSQIENRIWQVELLSTIDNDQKMAQLMNYIRKKMPPIEENPWYCLAALLMEMGELTEAERILETVVDLVPIVDQKTITDWSVVYRLGIVKLMQGHFTQALSLFQKALQLDVHGRIGFAVAHEGIALVHGSMGNYSTALSTHKKVLEILQTWAPNNHERLGISYGNVGDTYIRLGKPWDALSYLKKAVEIFEKSLPSNHPAFAIVYNWMGEAYRIGEDYSNALCCYEKALSIQEKYLPPNHIELAHTLNDMGIVYDMMGKHSRSLSCLLKTLYIRKNSLISDHPDIAKTYNNIGTVFKSMRHYLKALSCYQKALDIYEKFVDHALPDLATTYHNIAIIFDDMGDYSTALAFYQKTLKIEHKSRAHDHPTLATTYYNIARVYCKTGDYSTALSFLEKARRIQERQVLVDHPELAATYNQLAIVYLAMKDYSTALSFCEKNREIQDKCLHPNHSDLVLTYSNLAAVYKEMNDYSTALSFLEKSREIQEKYLHPDHPDLATIYNNLGTVYQEMNDYSTALSFLEKSREIQEKHFHPNHPDLATIYNNIAVIYDKMQDYTSALSFFQKSRLILEKHFRPDHPARVQACRMIVSIQQKMGNWPDTFSFTSDT